MTGRVYNADYSINEVFAFHIIRQNASITMSAYDHQFTTGDGAFPVTIRNLSPGIISVKISYRSGSGFKVIYDGVSYVLSDGSSFEIRNVDVNGKTFEVIPNTATAATEVIVISSAYITEEKQFTAKM
jgi:hypothetical protein